MKNFTLLTFDSYRDDLLKELQKFEDVHFRDLQKTDYAGREFLSKAHSTEKINFDEGELAKVLFCLNKLAPFVEKPKGLKALTEQPKTLEFAEFDAFTKTYDYGNVYTAIKKADESMSAAKAGITRLRAENESMRAWLKLDCSPAELEKLKSVKYLIGAVNKIAADGFRLNAESTYANAYVEFIGNIKDDVCILILLPEDEFEDAYAYFKTLGFSRLPISFTDTPAAIISSNEREIESLLAESNQAEAQIQGLAGEYESLQIVHDYLETLLERERVCQNFLCTKTVCMAEGWVPDEEAPELKKIMKRVCGKEYHLEFEEVASDSEEVPIKLKNNDVVASFEEVTAMFSMPKYNEIDPTPILMPFYMAFFGLMLGDAGYGLLMLAATWVALKYMVLKPGMKKFIQFFHYLSYATIFSGIIYGSMFGFAFFKPIPVGDGTYKAILDTQSDVMSMMIVSVALGVIQVITGIAVKGYMLIRDGKPLDAVYDSLLWIITILSGIGLLLGATGITPAAVSTISKFGLIIGMIGLAATQGRESPSLPGKIGSGLYAVYGISSYVGDLVSYTRIAALALSGAYIAFSFNLMATLIPMGIFRILFGLVIFVIGQALNIGLSALGAYVHTCRLQYVEFFGKFYEGGGVPFQAFKLKNKFININK